MNDFRAVYHDQRFGCKCKPEGWDSSEVRAEIESAKVDQLDDNWKIIGEHIAFSGAVYCPLCDEQLCLVVWS